MRTFMRAMILGSMIIGLLSCGKPEEESKRSSNSIPGTITNGVGTVYQDFNTLKSAFQNAGFNQGLQENMVVYHVGDMYGGSFSNPGFSGSAVFCIFGENLFGNDDACSGVGTTNTQLNNVIDQGEYKVVRSADSNSVSFGVATSVANGTFVFSDGIFDSSDEYYRDMLNLDNKEYHKVVVSEAILKMSTANIVKGNFIEYFFKDGTYEAYIVSTALPKFANPVITYKGSYSIGGGVGFQMKGRLNNVANNVLLGVSARYHMLVADQYQPHILTVQYRGDIR